MTSKRRSMLRKTNQSGFITMIIMIIAVLLAAVVFAYFRVVNANK